jgi:hypothetical protein
VNYSGICFVKVVVSSSQGGSDRRRSDCGLTVVCGGAKVACLKYQEGGVK